MSELQSDEEYKSIRLTGGGPKKLVEENKNIMDIFWEIMLNHTGGDPMNDQLKWTDLSVRDTMEHFKSKDCEVSECSGGKI